MQGMNKKVLALLGRGWNNSRIGRPVLARTLKPSGLIGVCGEIPSACSKVAAKSSGETGLSFT